MSIVISLDGSLCCSRAVLYLGKDIVRTQEESDYLHAFLGPISPRKGGSENNYFDPI